MARVYPEIVGEGMTGSGAEPPAGSRSRALDGMFGATPTMAEYFCIPDRQFRLQLHTETF